MKTNGFVIAALLSSAMNPAVAGEQLTPLYTDVLSAAESQSYTARPLSIKVATQQSQSMEALQSYLVVRPTHVVMLSVRGIVVLERTSTGMVKRSETVTELAQPAGSNAIMASPDGKTLVWYGSGGYHQMSITNDYQTTVTKLNTIPATAYPVSNDGEQYFVTRNNENGTTTAYQVTNNGLVQLATLGSNVLSSNSNVVFSGQDGLLFSHSTNWNNSLLSVFKLTNGALVPTAQLELDNINGISSLLYNYDSSTLQVSTYNYQYQQVRLNSQDGTIIDSSATDTSMVTGASLYSAYAVLKGEYSTIKNYDRFEVLKKNGTQYDRINTPSGYNNNYYFSLNDSTQEYEFWKNNKWSLQHYNLQQGNLSLKSERNAQVRGLPSFGSVSKIPSNDGRFQILTDSQRFVVITLDQDKKIKVVLDLDLESVDYSNKVSASELKKVAPGKYVMFEYNSYRVFTEDNQGKLTISESKRYPDNIGYIYQSNNVKVKDQHILFINGGLKLLEFKNDALTLRSTLTAESVVNSSDVYNISDVVSLNGAVYALTPDTGRVMKLKIADGKISIESAGTMPKLRAPFNEGYNRLYSSDYLNPVLKLDAQGNLVVMSLNDSSVQSHYFNKRLKIATQFSDYNPIAAINDSVTGIWQNIMFGDDCCEYNTSSLILNNHLVTWSGDDSKDIKVQQVNTAPYLPEQISPLQFNQGVSAEKSITAVLKDDEQTQLLFGKPDLAAFSTTEDGTLKYDGSAAGSGDLVLSVSDGELSVQLKLPYQINAAPALLKALPVVGANQNSSLQFDLSDYIADPEGSAIRFSAQNQGGFTLSKNGVLSGTPTGLGETKFAFQVEDHTGALLKSAITIKVNAAPTLTGNSNVSAKVGQTFALDLNTIVSDAEQHRLTITAQGLPAGLSLNGAVISGTPTASGSYNLILNVTDELGAKTQANLALAVAAEDKKGGGGAFGWPALALLALMIRRRFGTQTH